ncbi:MAG: Undecaprenyl-phosphate mannosyltransferase [Myxococcota bacterium]|nr:Undecaprenyl-phosphate mannosyltransferase [Myxococcota bacterium]
MNSRHDTVVIIPARNEAAFIGRVLHTLRDQHPDADIVVVNDYSTDRTAEIARAFGVHVVDLPLHGGYGVTIQTGIKFALRFGYRHAVTFDADGQHDAAEIETILGPCRRGETDLCVGSRYLHGGYPTGWIKRCGVWLFGALARLFIGKPVTDPTSGFKAFNRRAMRLYAADNLPDRFPDADAIIMAHRAGLRIGEVPVRMFPPPDDDPMHGGVKAVYYAFNMLFSIAMTVLRRDRINLEEERPAEASERAGRIGAAP